MRFPWLALLPACALLLTGCAGYRLGPTNNQVAGARSVAVSFFRNQTPEPGLVEPVATALRRRLQQDGTLRLERQSDADLLVEGTLLTYERLPTAFQRGDIATAEELELILIARVVATERASGHRILDRDVRGRTTVRVGSDLASAERQAAPLLADDLARNITAYLVEGAW